MPLLEAYDVSKSFAGIKALSHVSLDVEPAELVSLIGPNGAGKTTFFNCLLGVLHPDDGRVRFDGVDIGRMPVHTRARMGLARTFQRMELFTGMTVRETLHVAARAHRVKGSLVRDLLGRSSPTAQERADAGAILTLVGLDDVADRPGESLSLGRGRVVELARALMTKPKLLFLDEPSSGLDQSETDEMGEVLTTIQKDQGTAILLVEHDVPMVEKLSHRTYVLDHGNLISSGLTADVLADPAVRSAYIGQAVEDDEPSVEDAEEAPS